MHGPVSPAAFPMHVADETLRDLRERLMYVRWPDEPRGAAWSTGSSVDYVGSLWATGATASTGARRKPPSIVSISSRFPWAGGIDLHFIHEEGKGPNPMPLLLSHGWPGSVVEFHKILPMLTDPARFGGDPRDSFTVAAPSLAGYTLSFAPGQKRFGVEEISELFAELMTDVLGYGEFAAQGGDWGAFITSRLGYQFPERMIGIHLNMLAVRRDPKMLENPTAEEQTFLRELNHFLKEETGYQWIQGTKPSTLAFGLTDSPVGLAAWFGDVLQLRRAEIVNREIKSPLDLPIGVLGQANRTGLGDALQPRRNVDAVAHEIAVALLDDVAQMDPDAEFDAALGRQPRVALDEAVLHLDRAAHRVDHAAEFDEASVAGALNDASEMRGDGGFDQVAAQPPPPRQCAILVRSGELSIGAQKGPPIGMEKGPLLIIGSGSSLESIGGTRA